MRLGVICVLVISMIFSSTSPCFAQEPTNVERLILLVSHYSNQSTRYGVPVQTDYEVQIGEELIELVHQMVLETAAAEGDPSLGTKIWAAMKSKVLAKFNYKRLGKWVIATTRKMGPQFAIAMGVAEISSHLFLLYIALHPAMAFLLPVHWFKTFDFIVYGSFFGIPEIVKRLKTYKRFGGGGQSIEKFYDFLLTQRRLLPFDWSQVIDVQSLKIDNDGTELNLDVAILKKSTMEKYAPEKWVKVLFPRRLAQRQSGATLSIGDIESIAKEVGIELYFYRGFKISPQIYSKLLLKEILSRSSGSGELLKVLSLRSKRSNGQNGTTLDASEILGAENLADLNRLNESSDLLAQRLMWYLDDRLDAARASKTIAKSDYKILRAIAKASHDRLRRIAEAEEPDQSEAKDKLMDEISNIKNIASRLSSRLSFCAALLK